MLQQILKDMYIDPELLAELDDEQKQVLFCKLREEQVRRWKEREGKLDEEDKKRQKKSKLPKPGKNGKRQVGWLLGSDQQVWCWVMGDHEQDKTIDEILEDEAHVKAQKLAEQEAEDLARIQEEEMRHRLEEERRHLEEEAQHHEAELRKKAEKERQEEERKKQEEEKQQQMKLLRVRHELQRRKSIDEINQLKEKRSSEIYMSYRETRQTIEKLAEEDSKTLESEWREQEKKSKAAEEEIRAIARRAREEHRRSLTDTLRSRVQVIGKLATGLGDVRGEKPPVPSKPPSLRDKIGRPPKPGSKKAIVDWFKEVEYPKGTGRSPTTNQIEPWFHGIITRQDAEVLLQSEPLGTFLVRVSERIWGYAVSYRGPVRCKHFLIDTAGGNYQFFGTHQIAHAKLADLVNFHQVTPISNSGQEKLVRPCRQKEDPPNYQELFPAFNSITL